MGFFDLFKQSNINQGIEEYKRTDDAVLLDVRTPQEYQEGHIPESKNVPKGSRMPTRPSVLPISPGRRFW